VTIIIACFTLAMEKVRSHLRPKHQVLILKCYPRFQKSATDVKPNSSELSYLLYYASTRRSKVSKVGAFLDKKTVADVYKGRIGNVQVTLKILTALIDKTPRDLTLYAPYVLRVLATVLKGRDLTLVEESVGTWRTFCEHQDGATFAADQELIQMHEGIIQTYASFASRTLPAVKGQAVSAPMSVRWRTAGLSAIRAITSTEAIGADGGRQLGMIMPMILGNLYSEDGEYLVALAMRSDSLENKEKEGVMQRRMSMSTMKTDLQVPQIGDDADPATFSHTTADADRVAEEEVGALALSCLKNVFIANNRGEMRFATAAILKYIASKSNDANRPLTARAPNVTEKGSRPGTALTTASARIGSWATNLMEMVTRWAPVQDRFIIMVVIMEALVRSPIVEENLNQHLILVMLVDCLLSSSINMIGLSVMDVLLGLVQHTLLLLQLGGKGSNVLPHRQQTDAIDLFRDITDFAPRPAATGPAQHSKDERSPSTTRQRLLNRVQMCIGALANHIYYSDQVPDMITAILLRLKPSPLSPVSSAIVAVENPSMAAQVISDSINMQEDPSTDPFFSFGTARVTALNAIREILLVANSKATVTGAGAVGRNRVGVQVWEGTQWLLRDEDRRVRRAYVDSLVTWLRLEMSKNDLRIMEDRDVKSKKPNPGTGSMANGAPSERAVARVISNASRRSQATKPPRSTFLQLLHLAVYDNAIEAPENESEVLLLHLLLYQLIEKLGINAIKHGLPMIVRLQEDINSPTITPTPESKIVLGSLVHGYFAALTKHFECEATVAGFEISSEIMRRKEHGLWLTAITIPPIPLDRIMVSSTVDAVREVTPVVAQTESLRPFDALPQLVQQIALAYSSELSSPPSSPLVSPGKGLGTSYMAMPSVMSTTPGGTIGASSQAVVGGTQRATDLPQSVRDAMLTPWSKESCIANVEAAINGAARASSLRDSQRGTLRSHHNGGGFLHANGNSPRGTSPASVDKLPGGRSSTGALVGAQPTPLSTNLSPDPRQPRSPADHVNPNSSGSVNANGTPTSSEDHGPVLRFEELKRMLNASSTGSSSGARGNSPLRNSSTAHKDFGMTGAPRLGLAASVGAGNGSMDVPSAMRSSVSVGTNSMVDGEGLDSGTEEGAGEYSTPASQARPGTASMAATTTTSAGHSHGQALVSSSTGVTSPTTTNFSLPHPRPPSSHGSTSASPRPTNAARNAARLRSSSTASAASAEENPEANARALKGELVPTVAAPGALATAAAQTPVGAGSAELGEEVPPVPPLPEGVRASERRSVAERILSGIEVGRSVPGSGGVGGLAGGVTGKAVARPPY